ncbi:MAG: hypothetical protein WBC59_05425 [Phycisphaerae bacterium]
MNRRLILASVVGVAALIAAAGCEPKRGRRPAWTNPLDPMEANLLQDPNDIDYALQRMEFGRQAIRLGSYTRAKPRLTEAFEQLEVEHDATAAALSSERFKYYKGETYERAMLCTYLGIIEYQAGNYNDARIFLSRALSHDRGAVVHKNTPPEVGEDFGLAFYWIGKTYAKLGDADNAGVAFRKATTETPRKEKDAARELKEDRKEAAEYQKKRAEGEQWAYQTFTDPEKEDLFIEGVVNLAEVGGNIDEASKTLPGASPECPVLRAAEKPGEFFASAYQADCNLILTIELGRCPFKYLGGIGGERTEFGRPRTPSHAIRVYVDGHAAGPAFEALDLWNQAATQDRIGEKDAAQTGKAIFKEILSHAPYAGSLAGHWDVSGDARYWMSLPGKVYLFAAKATPGPHTVRLEVFDVDGNRLPRWTNTYYGVGVPERGEACILLNPRFNGDNRLSLEQVQKAIKGGVSPGAAYAF